MSMLIQPGVAVRSVTNSAAEVQRLYAAVESDFARYEVVKDIVDECIDLSLNYRQSGHPGGSRSKVHLLLALLLSGAMRWDIRRPGCASATASCSSAGHTCPWSTPPWRCSTRRCGLGTRDRRRALRLPRRGRLGAHLGGPAGPSPPRRASRATPRWRARPSS